MTFEWTVYNPLSLLIQSKFMLLLMLLLIHLFCYSCMFQSQILLRGC